MTFSFADIAIVAILLLSAVVSLFRGFFREAIAVLGWVAAVWLALVYTEMVSVHLEPYIATPSLRQAAAFGLIFLAVLIVAGVAGHLVNLLVKGTGLGGTDRVLGAVFGAARGVLIVGLAVLFAGMTAIPNDPWWRESQLIPHFERLVEEARIFLPQALRERLGDGFGALIGAGDSSVGAGGAETAPAAVDAVLPTAAPATPEPSTATN